MHSIALYYLYLFFQFLQEVVKEIFLPFLESNFLKKKQQVQKYTKSDEKPNKLFKYSNKKN